MGHSKSRYFFSGVTQFFFTAFLSLLGLFYFLKDGARIKKWVVEILPLSPKYTDEIVIEIENVASSVIKGTLVSCYYSRDYYGYRIFYF